MATGAKSKGNRTHWVPKMICDSPDSKLIGITSGTAIAFCREMQTWVHQYYRLMTNCNCLSLVADIAATCGNSLLSYYCPFQSQCCAHSVVVQVGTSARAGA